MELSIIPDLINTKGIEFTDVNGIKISICEKSKYLFNESQIKKPFILIDLYEKQKYKKIEIRSIGLDTLKKYGYRIVKVRTTPKIKNRLRQVSSYILEQIGSPIPSSEVLIKIPREHFIEFDLTNTRVRLRGINVWPYNRNENATPWIEVEQIE